MEKYLNPVVYVVDDDEVVRDSLRALLESRRFVVVDFASGRDLLKQHRSLPPGCAVLDVHMPDITGVETLRALRAEGNAMPVILMWDPLESTCRHASLSIL